MAESGGECLDGDACAQCILNACEIDGIRPAEAVKKYVYAKARPEPSDSVKDAVEAVFDKGETVTDEPIVYFCNLKLCDGSFHKTQNFEIRVGDHWFYSKKEG